MRKHEFYGLEYEINGVRLGDILIEGKRLRDYTPTEFASYRACLSFSTAVFDAIPVGTNLDDIIGQEFHNAFFAHRDRFIQADEMKRKTQRIHELIRVRLGKDALYEVLCIFEVAHVGWEMDNDYAAFRHEGVVKYVGTDHGGARIHDRAYIEDLLQAAEQQVTEIRDALRFT